jgi:hypothetical protein
MRSTKGPQEPFPAQVDIRSRINKRNIILTTATVLPCSSIIRLKLNGRGTMRMEIGMSRPCIPPMFSMAHSRLCTSSIPLSLSTTGASKLSCILACIHHIMSMETMPIGPTDLMQHHSGGHRSVTCRALSLERVALAAALRSLTMPPPTASKGNKVFAKALKWVKLTTRWRCLQV